MYIPKYFTPKELFPPEISIPINGKFDPRNWRRFDERILMMADQIREDHGPMTGNEGGLTGCGFRLPIKKHATIHQTCWDHYDFDTLSQHPFGRAIDGHPKEKDVFSIRKSIILNRFKYLHIHFLEIDIFGKNSGKPWLHFDCRNFTRGTNGAPQLWSPKRGFVSVDEYLQWGDK